MSGVLRERIRMWEYDVKKMGTKNSGVIRERIQIWEYAVKKENNEYVQDDI